MKTNKIMIAAMGLLAMGGFSSCSDSWLDVDSKTESNSENYYQSQEDGLRALYACYDGWQCTVSDGPTFTLYQLTETMSDECFGGTGNNDGRNTQILDRFDMNQSPSYTNMHNQLWKSYYAAIFRCNELIDKSEGINWTSESLRNTYLGEAYAIRAFCYFDLLRIWENVPLIVHATSDNVPQAAPDSVYAQCISDLKQAITMIPANAYPKAEAATNDGHITKYAAEAILARLYLFYDGYYNGNAGGSVVGMLTKQEALAACEDIIQSGEFALVPRFKDLWPGSCDTKNYENNWLTTGASTYAGNGNAETVLSMKFNYTADYNGNNDGNRFIVMAGLRTGSCVYSRYGQGWGAMTVNTKLASAYGPGDSRRQASIIDCATLDGYEDNYISDQREYTGYAIKKYTALSKLVDGKLTHYTDGDAAGDFQISQYQDWVLVRYADVLLMAAELGSSNAKAYFDAVRKRAYTDDDGSLNSNYVELSATRENIWNERKKEFAFEGIRYWDELRQGLETAASQIAENNTTVLSGGVKDNIVITTQNIISKRGFCQIPLEQITLSNNTLKQNAGW